MLIAGVLTAIGVLSGARPSSAIPAFARKYGTSCLTCHTVYPKLTPFGEAFRRNGYRFPGIDSDYWKANTVPMGQEAASKLFPEVVWPGSLPAPVPLAPAFSGSTIMHPDQGAGGAAADNHTSFTFQDLISEGSLWAGGSLSENVTFFGELSVSEEGAELEHGIVIFEDLLGPKHALNLSVGKMIPAPGSFGAHSSYIVDLALTSVRSRLSGGRPANPGMPRRATTAWS